MKLRKARNSDVPQIRNLINSMALRTDDDYKHGHMLPRSLTELYEHIRDYTVLVEEAEGQGQGRDRVLGCCALESQWDGLAELKAMAVDDAAQGHGWGRALIGKVLSECEELSIDCVYLLTNKMEFFAHLGFEPIDMRHLPQRVWSECTNCPKFMVACDEVAMTYQGQRPRQTFIPAVGNQASPAARAALGLLPVINNGDQLNGLSADNSPQHAANGSNSNSSGSNGSTGQHNGSGGLMNSDGYSPPFRPHPEE